AGDNTAVPAGVTTDISGSTRLFDVASVTDSGNGAAPIVDMGAYEAQYVPLTPIAKAGGPYSVREGSSVTLSGTQSSETGGSIAGYRWDFDYNGSTFTADASGATATFSAAGLDGPSTRTIALKVTDGSGQSAIATATVNITDAPPIAKFAGGSVTVGSAGKVSFSSQSDPSPADVAAGFKYSYDFNNDGVFEITDSSSASATVPATYLATTGNHSIHGRIKDKDGGFTDYTTTITVTSSTGLASVSGTVFADNNGNATLDSGELGVSGRKLYIDKNKNGVLDLGEPTFTTGANGAFSFTSLAAGTYRIRDVLPSGWRRTSPTAGYFDVTVFAGQVVTGKNFAETTRGLISGTVFADNNGNAKLDAGELGVSGRKLYIDKNKNGLLDVGEPTFTTGANGSFTFNGLLAGTYRVRDVLPTGWRRTSPTAGYFDVTVAAGQAVTGKNFAETTRGLISGIVFKDANGNGIKDSTESVLSGWVVYLDTNNNGKLDAGELSFTTGLNGKFSFVVPAGTYHLRGVLKSGFKRTAPSTGVYNITLSSGQSATGKNFGDK
ncbi:MAG TPA: SdrD B-like domain-containing protein, partial [Bryobacteraceae bacterium]|nr:SdrD B-like domain-containing protein [Bryobacteraceae bacterium]